MKKQKTKKFKVLIECEMEYSVGDVDTDDDFARDGDFTKISTEIIQDVLKENADNIKILSVKEQKEEKL
jgi:hypothetical protein